MALRNNDMNYDNPGMDFQTVAMVGMIMTMVPDELE
jgi:hypothetical protein